MDVTGEVTLDGNPVGTGADATIRFEPAGGQGSTEQVFLDNGKFSAKLRPGGYKVMISWQRSKGKPAAGRPAGPGAQADASEEVIPAAYNKNSNLTLDVARGMEPKRFDLKSK
jgi:hypothetical protein